MFPQAQHFIGKEYSQNYFEANVPPVLRVSPGEIVHLETNDCYHGKIIPPSNDVVDNDGDASSINNAVQVLSGLTTEQLNPITGPIYIEGAMPGDLLVIKLLDIKPQGVGIACCGPSLGQLSHLVSETTVRFFDLSNDGKTVTMRDTIESHPNNAHRHHDRVAPLAFPSSPMLGVIGVAPAGQDPVLTMPAGKHGGNLDNNNNGIGSTIYIPVNHAGALLSMGDMHASQGDGEISGTGVEISGHVLFQCQVIKEHELYGRERHTTDTTADRKFDNLRIEYPVTETETHWITHGVVVENIPETTKIACEEAAKLLVGQWGFTIEEAFIFLSVKGNLGLCQSCHPDTGTQIAKMTVPKLPMCPRPFRVL